MLLFYGAPGKLHEMHVSPLSPLLPVSVQTQWTAVALQAFITREMYQFSFLTMSVSSFLVFLSKPGRRRRKWVKILPLNLSLTTHRVHWIYLFWFTLVNEKRKDRNFYFALSSGIWLYLYISFLFSSPDKTLKQQKFHSAPLYSNSCVVSQWRKAARRCQFLWRWIFIQEYMGYKQFY